MAMRRGQWISTGLETAAYWLLIGIIVLAPLPFGSNGPESTVVLAGFSGLLLLLTAGALLTDPVRFEVPRAPPLTFTAIAFSIALAWSLIQLAPYVPPLLPHPLWHSGAAVLGGTHTNATISIDPDLSWHAIAKTLGYLAMGISAVVIFHDPQRRRTACSVFAVAAAAYAAYGIIGLLSGDCCVVWERKTAYFGVATGPFINRNSFATYLGLSILVSLGHILREVGELRHVSARSRLRTVIAKGSLLVARQWIIIASLILATTALLLTSSRAGTTSTLLGGAVLVLLLSQAKIFGNQRRILHFSAFALIAGLVIAIFGGAFLNRFAQDGVEDVDRTQSWEIIVTGIETSPWLGHGFGTFPESFPLYRDDRLASRRYWDKAQDTYLELALDLGIPATLFFLGGFAALGVQCFKGLSRRRRERRIYPAIGLAATVLIGAHALVDFSMQIPAIATTFAFIMGIAITESGIWRSRIPAQSSAT